MKPHRARVIAMQAVFQIEFHEVTPESLLRFQWIDYSLPQDEKKFAEKIIRGTLEKKDEIDELIIDKSENWDFSRVSPVNKAILRTAIFQLLYVIETDARIILDEAVKISQEYAEDDASRYINGVLDSIYRDLSK